MERHEYVVQAHLDLVRGNMVRIEDGRGLMVRVVSGEVWITEEGDPRDRFVTAGGWSASSRAASRWSRRSAAARSRSARVRAGARGCKRA